MYEPGEFSGPLFDRIFEFLLMAEREAKFWYGGPTGMMMYFVEGYVELIDDPDNPNLTIMRLTDVGRVGLEEMRAMRAL